MMSIKSQILKNISYTELVYIRINKKLQSEFTNKEIEDYIERLISRADEKLIHKKGKNYYLYSVPEKIRMTINSNTFRIITVDRTS